MIQSGSTIGGIRIDALLGRGAMGEVYRGVQLSLKRPVAVKRIAEHLLGDAEAATRFTREAQVVARVQSPYVVAVYDFGRHRDEQGVEHGLLVMELVDGGASLRALLAARGRAFDWRTATALILHVAEGLAAAAEFGVVHRDIKPDNIMVTAKGTAKLADFGLAKSVDSSAMTLEGAVLGTPLYLPPEACRGEPVDARGDLYSLGCTWFHLLAGRPPFQAASTVALLRAHLDDLPPDLRSIAPEVPEAIASLVMRLLAKHPEQRLPSAQALVDALHGLAAHGLIIPRAVPEVFGVEEATAITRLANHGGDPSTAATQRAGSSPSSVAATMPLVAIAATVVAPSTPLPGATAPAVVLSAMPSSPVSSSIAASSPIASSTGLSSGPLASSTPPAALSSGRRPLRIIIPAVIVVALVIGAALMLRGDGARSAIEAALASKDYGLALQRAGANLTARPGDADAVALVKLAAHAELSALAADGRPDDAKRRIGEYHAAWSWLDTSAWEREIAIAQAVWLADHKRFNDATDAFMALRKLAPDDMAVCRAMVDSLADSDRPAAAIGAAYQLASHGDGPLDAKTLSVLTYSLGFEGPFSDFSESLRAVVLKRHPAIIDTVRPWLTVDDYEKRYNAAFLLKAAGKLSDSEEIRHHWRAVTTLSSSYSTTADSVVWLASEAQKPNWSERKAAAKLPPITDPVPLKTWNEHAEKVCVLFGTAFLPEVGELAVKWAGDQDETLRWNGVRVLTAGKILERIDMPAFHAKTLATFNPLYESEPFTTALAFFVAKAGTPDAPAGKAALEAGVRRCEEQAALYDKANVKGMPLHASGCRKRAAQVQAALAKF